MQDLGTLGGSGSAAYGINHDGRIVGTAQTVSGDYHAFMWEESQMDDLNTLLPFDSGWIVTEANGVNRTGDIIGGGNRQAFLMRR